MDNFELVMNTDLETALPKTIDFNFEGLKIALSDSLKLYRGLVVTEESIKPAKDDRARLNKLREALEAKRKDVKKECLAPYNDFERKVKELVGMIDEPISAIDGQLKIFEEKRREEKRAEVEEIFKASVGDLADILPFSRVWEETWYNVGSSIKKITESITAKVEKVRGDLLTLSTVESEFSEAVKLKYLETLDLGAALQERAKLQEQAKRLREYEEKKAAEAAAAAAAAESTPEPSPDYSEPEAVQDATEQTKPAHLEEIEHIEQVYLLRFECKVTREQAAELSQYLKLNNISYRRI